MLTAPTKEALFGAPDLESLNSLLAPLSLRAGWNKHEPSLWQEPRTGFRSTVWSWGQAKSALDAAGRLIDTEKADRRNLFMVNPHEGNYYSTLRTLVCAYQMILPDEQARSHRHTPNALRFVLETGEDCYTVVDGHRIDMRPGDVLLTPNWAWHGHANVGSSAGYWIDYLDVPLVHLLEPMFLEHWPDGLQPVERNHAPEGFVFPWAETGKRLAAAAPDQRGLRRIDLESDLMPTIALDMTALPEGGSTASARTTANQVFTVVSGSGHSIVNGRELEWSRGDVLVVPAWQRFQHHAQAESVLFGVSDRPVMECLGFLRTETE